MTGPKSLPGGVPQSQADGGTLVPGGGVLQSQAGVPQWTGWGMPLWPGQDVVPPGKNWATPSQDLCTPQPGQDGVSTRTRTGVPPPSQVRMGYPQDRTAD